MIKCRKCGKITKHDKLVVAKNGLACPVCDNRHFDKYDPKKPPYKFNEVDVTYEEGQGT